MSEKPLLITTLGFISAISRTILAIATLGLIDHEVDQEVKDSGGGGGVGWGEMPVDYPGYFQPRHKTIDIAVLASAIGLV